MPPFLPQTNRGCDTLRQAHASADALGVIVLENLILTLDVAYPKAFLLQVFGLPKRPAKHQNTLCSLPSVLKLCHHCPHQERSRSATVPTQDQMPEPYLHS